MLRNITVSNITTLFCKQINLSYDYMKYPFPELRQLGFILNVTFAVFQRQVVKGAVKGALQ